MSTDLPFGNHKQSQALLWNLEQRLLVRVVPKVPGFLNGVNLTLLSILWCVGTLVSYIMAPANIHWLWLTCAGIVLQYCTDALDGAVARYRNSGLIRWGYYMDHFLDFCFLVCIFIGLTYLAPSQATLTTILACGFVFVAFMVHSFLLARATDEFHISFSKIGPTELRLFVLIINITIILIGPKVLTVIAPAFLVLSTLALVTLVVRTQKRLFDLDRTR
ncbi:MAG: CDP-alcohol phosphatidyltransferase family protein [Patescibacteria group bacterium]